MSKKSLVATRPLRYATRRLTAGDMFEASAPHARLLVGIGKAKYQELGAPPEGLARKIQQTVAAPAEDDLTGLRAEYLRVVGKRAFNGWDAATLRGKITAAGG